MIHMEGIEEKFLKVTMVVMVIIIILAILLLIGRLYWGVT